MNFKKLGCRIYSDFFLPSRLDEYKSLLAEAIEYGYDMHSIRSFWRLIVDGAVRPERKYFINRHDIDTDLSVARSMFEIEKALKVPASYYFRLSTLDIALIKAIEAAGSEAGYHYEELSTEAKLKGYKTRDEVIRHMQTIRRKFTDNLMRLRDLSGLPIKIVASHGDFVNQILGVPNHAILADGELRKRLGIELEVYDEAFMKFVTSRHSDTLYPAFYTPRSPREAIREEQPVIYFLSHPRHWRANPRENLTGNMVRIWEGIKFKVMV